MPAAPAIAPLLGVTAVNTTSPTVVPATGDAFGKMLRSVWAAASDPASEPAPNDDVQGLPARAAPEQEPAAIVEAAPDQVVTAATALPVGSSAARQAAPVEKHARVGEIDSQAAVAQAVVSQGASPDAASAALSIVAAASAAPVVVSGQTSVPPTATPPARAVPPARKPATSVSLAAVSPATVADGPVSIQADPVPATLGRDAASAAAAAPAEGLNTEIPASDSAVRTQGTAPAKRPRIPLQGASPRPGCRCDRGSRHGRGIASGRYSGSGPGFCI